MKNRKRKGFTIVELVIVIAIVAVLAGVLIPTFASIIDKANQSADIQAARQLNDALVIGSVENKPDDIDDVKIILSEAGYDSEKSLKPITTGYRFFWYAEENTIILAQIPDFVDKALALDIPNNGEPGYEVKVVYPEGRDVEGSVAHKFETILNELVKILVDEGCAAENYDWDTVTAGDLVGIISTKVASDPTLSPMFSSLINLISSNLWKPQDHLGENTPVSVPVDSVQISATLSLTAGNFEILTPTILPSDATNKSLNWVSSNTAVATVNNGVVTAVGAGETTITATTNDGSGIYATCTVTVTAPAQGTVSVTGVSLNKQTTTLTVGGTETLIATVAPNNATDKSVTWSSNTPGVATVDQNGQITAVSAGTATITVKTTDGNFTATCTVTVNPAVVAVTGVTLDKTDVTLTVGGTETLIATVAPNDATDKTVTWSSDAEGVATVENGVVTAVSAGTATITVTTKDGGHTDTCTVTVKAAGITTTAELIAALEAGGEHSLGADVTLDVATTVSVNTTIDLKGHTLTLADPSTVEQADNPITVQGTLEIVDNSTDNIENAGTIIISQETGVNDYAYYFYCGICVNEGGTLTISGVNIAGNREGTDIYNEGTVSIENSKFAVNNGGSGVYNDEGGTATISGTDFTVNDGYGVFHAGGTATITNGEFVANGTSVAAIHCEGGTLSVTGTEFSEGTGFTSYYALAPIDVSLGGTGTLENVTVTVSDGNTSANLAGSSSLTIKSGSYSGPFGCSDSTITIEGGTFGETAFATLYADAATAKNTLCFAPSNKNWGVTCADNVITLSK